MKQKVGQRLIISLDVALSEGGTHYVIETENLSSEGLCLSPTILFPVGTRLHLVLGQPPELPTLSAEGIVRWSEGGKGVGVEFTSIRPQDREAILRFVKSQSHH
jgi:PilZ domain-containing protein